jgi:hypothetical protein
MINNKNKTFDNSIIIVLVYNRVYNIVYKL